MKSDQARLLRMAAVLLSVACSSTAIAAAGSTQGISEHHEAVPFNGKDSTGSIRKQTIGVSRDQRIEFFSRNPAV